MGECLSNTPEALGSIPGIAKKRRKDQYVKKGMAKEEQRVNIITPLLNPAISSAPKQRVGEKPSQQQRKCA